MSITATHITYLHTCHRKLWLFANGIQMEHNSVAVAEGKLIGETTYLERSRKYTELAMEGIKINFYDAKEQVVHEVKKSDKMEEAHIAQVKYYLYVLRKNGIENPSGIIEYPKLRQRQIMEWEDGDQEIIEGWIESQNTFGDCLVAPKELREEWSKGLAKAIVNWKITSNQSRTFSLMETLAISISDNAHLVGASIRAKLSEEDSRKATPIIEENLDGVNSFISVQAGGFIPTTTESIDAMQKAEQALADKIMAFDFENQV